MDTQEQALLDMVLANPTEDAPRLVYADWFEEHGQCERAEFIRVQCELANNPTRRDCRCVSYDDPARQQTICRFLRREIELLPLGLGSGQGWFNVAGRWTYQNDGTNQQEWPFLWIAPEDDISFGRIYGRPARGFVDAVRLTMAQWCGTECLACGGQGTHHHSSRTDLRCEACHGSGRLNALGPLLVQAAPLIWVECSDREPADRSHINGEWYWFRDVRGESGTESHLPDMIFDLLAGRQQETIGLPYTTRDAAHAALSDASILWAKSLIS